MSGPRDGAPLTGGPDDDGPTGYDPVGQGFDPASAAFSAMTYDSPAPAAQPYYPLTQSLPGSPQPPTAGYPSMPPPPALAPGSAWAGQYPPPGYGYGGYPPPQKANGQSIAGFVCGLLGVVLCAVPYLGVILGILGISLSVPGRNKARRLGQKTGLATAGMVLGIIAVAVFLVLLVLFLAAWGTFGFTGGR